MIERLQKLSAEIFKAALRTYTKKDVLAYKKSHAHNLTQILSLFPNQGVGFYAFKKNWTPGIYYQIKRAQYKSYKHGHFYGLKYIKFPSGKQQLVDQRPKRLQGFSKRGIWTYSIGKFQKCKVNNGVVYNKADLEAFIKVRGIGISKNPQGSSQVDAQQLEEQAQAIEAEQEQ